MIDFNKYRLEVENELSLNYQIIEGFRKNDTDFDKNFLEKITKNLEKKYEEWKTLKKIT